MKRKLRLGDSYALAKHKSKHPYIRYISLLAVATIMCLYAHAQRPDHSGPVLSGIVTDTTGAAISGATIMIKGTATRNVTDMHGRFTLRASKTTGTLMVSYLGHQTIEEKFKAENGGQFHFTLLPLENLLEEVEVSTGYQTIAKERFVGSAFNLDSTALQRRVGVGILQRLDGTVPGALFDKKSGNGARILIRGISSLGGVYYEASQRQPLIVLDNFPFEGDLSEINENDIASISILKDAAAASIWGAKAGNGVIVITTKQGRFNQPVRLSFQSNIGYQSKRDLFYYPSMTTGEFMEMEEFLYDKGYFDAKLENSAYPYNWPVVSPLVELLDKSNQGVIDPAELDNQLSRLALTDIREELNHHWYRNVVRQQHHMNFSGGGERFNYSISGGYNQSSADIQGGDGKQTFTLATNNAIRPIEGLLLSIGSNIGFTDDRNPAYLLPDRLYPYLKLTDDRGYPSAVPQGYRTSYIDTAGGGNLLDWHYRPLEEVSKSDNLNRHQLTRLNLGVAYELTPWLQAEFRYQYNDRKTAIRNHYSEDTWTARDLINRYTNFSESATDLRYPVPIGGILDMGEGRHSGNHYRVQVQSSRLWNDGSTFSAMLAAEKSEIKQWNNASRLYGYSDVYGTYKTNIDYQALFPMYNTTFQRSPIPSGLVYQPTYLNRTISFLANASYSFKNRYTVYGSARRDGSNLFGVETNNKWKPLWSVGASWELSREPFKLPETITYLRLRASYGFTGNVNNSVSGYTTMIYQNVTASTSNLNDLPRAQLINPPNPHLRWEQVQMFNGGLDFRLFKNRITGSLDIFHKHSSDLISTIPFDPTTGVLEYTVNAASLKGGGFELTMRTENLNRRIRWYTDVNLSFAKMIVTRLYKGGYRASDFITYGLQPAEGRVAYGISSYRWAGLDPTTGDPRGYYNDDVSKDYTSIFNDSVENQVFHGSAIPLYSGNISNTIAWKGFELSANLTFRAAFFFREPALSYSALFEGTGLHASYARRWREPGDENITNVPSMLYPIPSEVAQRDQFFSGAEIHVKRGDNIRIQDVRLSWNLAKSRLGKTPIKNVQLFIYGNNLNLIIWKAYPGKLDADYSGNNITASPMPKSWAVGLNLSI